jgi:hypothetical protein
MAYKTLLQLEFFEVWTDILDQITVVPRFATLISSSKTARKAKTCKTKINFPLLPEKRRQEQQVVCERQELV